MRRIFVDTSHFVAMLIPEDDLHDRAVRVSASLGDARFFTSDSVLVEVLAYLSGRGRHARLAGVRLVEEVSMEPRFSIVYQDRALFEQALTLYQRRIDKTYSLTDCLSMVICRKRRITEVLTHDRHFSQEGFTILL